LMNGFTPSFTCAIAAEAINNKPHTSPAAGRIVKSSFPKNANATPLSVTRRA
jgi:hypothetical protein